MAQEVSEIKIERPRWEPPKARIVETALDEDKMLVTGLCNNSIQSAYIEPAATLVIGSIMEVAGAGEYDKLMAKHPEYVKAELEKLNESDGDRLTREKIATTRAWLRLVNEAKKHFAKFTRAAGNEVVLAVIREKTCDKEGKEMVIVDAQDVDNPFAAVKKTYVLARAIARKITRENQDVTVVIVGSKGKGKSWFALSLAEAIAKELSMIFYKDEDHWLEYWNYREDTAIIDDDSILKLLQAKTGKHHIKVLDDVGYSKGIDSRKWASAENAEANSTVSVNRTENGVTIYTTQSHFFVDKKIRLLLTYYIEMTGPKVDGVNRAQLHEMTLHPRDGDDPLHYPFVYRTWFDKATGEEHTIMSPVLCGGAPSLEVISWYEPARTAAAEAAIDKKREKDSPQEFEPEPKKVTANEAVAAYLVDHPEAKALEVVDGTGKSLASVLKCTAWQTRSGKKKKKTT